MLDYCGSLSEEDVTTCGDGIDNDGDGFTDCADYSCSDSDDAEVLQLCASKQENSISKCKDGIDNDGNGFTDCDDFSCKDSDELGVRRACQESVGSAAEANEACSDGKDNDGDGFVDCDDWDCSWNPVVCVCCGRDAADVLIEAVCGGQREHCAACP